MSDTHDKRRSRRIQVHGEVDGTGNPNFKAAVVNLSREGVCFEHGVKLDPGQVCDLKFRIPPMSFFTRARVVWTKPYRPPGPAAADIGVFRSGAEFTEISDDARAAIEAIVLRPPE